MRTINKGHKPEQIKLNGTVLKNFFDADLKGYPHTNRQKHNIAAELQAQGLKVCLVAVLNPKLKGKSNLHQQPYKPSIFIYSNIHTETDFKAWRERVDFWKKCFAPRTKKYLKEVRARNNSGNHSFNNDPEAQNQAIKELFN